MAQIINYDPEDNPRLQQIYQILLLAGYFRIRIASLKAFDKVIGGIAWCITSSNFQIDIDYNDEMQIGQKIKVSQHICSALKNMKCPFNLQPFQLQGLDVNNIFPVVQWLIKFVYETRFERQKYNREIALKVGKKIVDFGIQGNSSVLKPFPQPKRMKINKAVMQTAPHNPIRVYSALLQSNDMTSLRMYNKLHNMMLTKRQRQKSKNSNATYNTVEDNDDQNNVESDFLEIMNPDKEKQVNQEFEAKEFKVSLEQHFDVVGTKISLQKLERIIEENKQNYETALKETVEEGQSMEENLLKKVKQQNVHYEEQIKVLQSQLQNYQSTIAKTKDELEKVKEKKVETGQKLEKRMQKFEQIEEYGKQIEQELKKQKINQATMEKLVEKKMKLKEKKAQVKNKGKAKIEELQQMKQTVEASIPEIDEEVFNQMLEEAETKKQIYDKKYEQLTQINQELAILQRKAQNFTSAPEIAQYHQRFVELFEAINLLIEEKRSIYGQMANLQGIQKLINNDKEFLLNAKEGVMNAKSKEHKKELADDLRQIFIGFEKNMNNSKLSHAKIESNLEKTYSEYTELVKLQKDYMKKLRQLKIEYENSQRIYQ